MMAGMHVLPELEGNKVRDIMRIRVTKVFSPVRYTFGESISLTKKRKVMIDRSWKMGLREKEMGGMGCVQ